MINKYNIFENKNEQNDFIIALIVIVVFIVFVFMLFKMGISENQFLKKEVLIENTSFNTNTLNVENDKLLKNNQKSNIESTKKNQSPIPSSKNDTISALVPSNTITEPDLTRESRNSYVNSTNSKTVETLAEEETIHSAVPLDHKVITTENNNIEIEDKTAPKINNDTIKTEHQHGKIVSKTVTPATPEVTTKVAPKNTSEPAKVKQINTNNIENCIIVVGAYRNENNLIKTIRILEDNGYTSVSGLLNNNMHYVGVPISCQEKRSTKTKRMNELNSIFNVTSWIIKK